MPNTKISALASGAPRQNADAIPIARSGNNFRLAVSDLIAYTPSGSGAVVSDFQTKLRESVSVKDFGAVGDGVTSSATAFTNAYTTATANDTIKVTPGNFVTGAISGSKSVLWDCDGALDSTGTSPLDLPGVVETMYERRKLFRVSQGTSSDICTLNVQRVASYSGGTPGFVNSALKAETVVSAGVTNFEWALVGVVDNSATAGENTGVYGQVLQRSTGPSWGGVFEARDLRNTANTLGSLVGLEVDCFANGTDSNNTRGGVDVVIGKGTSGGSQCEAFFGVRVGPLNGDTSQGRVKQAFTVTVDTDCAFDASSATFTAGGPAFRMAVDHYISFTATNDRTLGYTSSGLRYRTSGVTRWSCDDTGVTNQTNVLQINGTQVLTSRRTGYTNAMTGTANRATLYDTATITLVQLAQRVKAIQDDLSTHGLIGP